MLRPARKICQKRGHGGEMIRLAAGEASQGAFPFSRGNQTEVL
jgi:hypothetical protein